MLRVASIALAVIASFILVDSLSAQQTGRGHGRGQGDRGGLIERVEKNKDLKLTDDQKAKLEELKKEYAPKEKALTGKREGVLTADQKKARDDARKAAKDAGKSRREIFQAGMEAVKLTDAQKATMADVRKAAGALNKEISEKVNKILTPEQQEILKKARGNRGGHRNRGGDNPPSQVN
jgi:Spy/CpxP family protein refolding chaperone